MNGDWWLGQWGFRSHPVPGRSGWQRIHPEFVWTLRENSPPYCVWASQSATATTMPCRTAPGYPCCRRTLPV